MRPRLTQRTLAALLTVCGLACSGCNSGLRTIGTDRLKGPYEISTRNESEQGWGRAERPIPAGSPEEAALAAWLDANRSGWSSSITTYAPGNVIVNGGNFKLTVGKNCIFSRPALVGSDQLVKTLDDQSFAQLQAIIKAAESVQAAAAMEATARYDASNRAER